MPKWEGKWLGGRFYRDEQGRKVFCIESCRKGIPRSITLKTHDERLAEGQLAAFRDDADAFYRGFIAKPVPQEVVDVVNITKDRLKDYLSSIQDLTKDYYNAKKKDLYDWSQWRDENGQAIDLKSADKKLLRRALASFRGDGTSKRRTGGFKRRAESLNCFGNFLVREGDLKVWSALHIMPNMKPAQTRAERVAYTPEEVWHRWSAIPNQRIRDVLHLRTATGMHDTEIQQLAGAKLYKSVMPDRHPDIGPAFIRTHLDKEHADIKGVLQFRQKTKPRHRVSVDDATLKAALRLAASGVPSRFETYNVCIEVDLIPSNLRHTYTTLRGKGQIVHYDEGGVSLDEVAEILGHRPGSKMTASRYDKLQVPPMMKLPLTWDYSETAL